MGGLCVTPPGAVRSGVRSLRRWFGRRRMPFGLRSLYSAAGESGRSRRTSVECGFRSRSFSRSREGGLTRGPDRGSVVRAPWCSRWVSDPAPGSLGDPAASAGRPIRRPGRRRRGLCAPRQRGSARTGSPSRSHASRRPRPLRLSAGLPADRPAACGDRHSGWAGAVLQRSRVPDYSSSGHAPGGRAGDHRCPPCRLPGQR